MVSDVGDFDVGLVVCGFLVVVFGGCLRGGWLRVARREFVWLVVFCRFLFAYGLFDFPWCFGWLDIIIQLYAALCDCLVWFSGVWLVGLVGIVIWCCLSLLYEGWVLSPGLLVGLLLVWISLLLLGTVG